MISIELFVWSLLLNECSVKKINNNKEDFECRSVGGKESSIIVNISLIIN